MRLSDQGAELPESDVVTAAMPGQVVSAVAVALGVLLTAFVVFLAAGAGEGLGPLDLQTADRLALVLFIGAPTAGGLVGRGLSTAALGRAALIVGLSVGLLVALFPTSGTGDYSCWLTLPTVPFGYLVGRLVIGALIGSGMGFGLFAAGVSARSPIAVLPGVALASAVTFLASRAAYELFYGAVRCL